MVAAPRSLYRLNAIADALIVNGWAGHVSKSTDDGLTWTDMGKVSDSPLYAIECLEHDGSVPTEPGDWFDHFICFAESHARHLVGGTSKGFILHARLPQ